ncbi:unnamed protein product [Leptidea sinapis]|uniref:MRG-binding protein n=1 Tax=Leptidea sinapis TaxID=189913 RepID=A0A5E4PN93_9NEOP|nr:unnamed protein product [Leptidea sinapis]
MASNEEEESLKTAESVDWDVDMEIQLFYAMADHKPVGIDKHFHMACIWEKLSNSITKEITTEDIWKHLSTLYDTALLDETEPIPFPNHEVDFSLPEDEYGYLMKQKCKDLGEENEDARSISPKPAPRSNSRGTSSKDGTPKGRKDSISSLATKSRKESASSHASTDTTSIKSEKDYERRRDSRDSNASGPRDGSGSRKSTSQKDKSIKNKIIAPTDDDSSSRRCRRRANTSTPPNITPAKRRRI